MQVFDIDGTITVRSATEEFSFDDAPPWLGQLLHSLDGTCSVEAAAERLRRGGTLVHDRDISIVVDELHTHGLVEDAAFDNRLSQKQRTRYDRQLRYFSERSHRSTGAECQAQLIGSRVCLLGLGALGGQVLQTLAAAGVGAITAVDGDTVELSNLNRQTLYAESDIGRPKVDVATERVGQLNPEIDFRANQAWLRSRADVAAAARGCDLVIDAVDNPPHHIERWVNDACFGLGTPYIAMSHYPPAIRVGPTYIPGETGCYRCQESAWRQDDALFDATPTGWRPAATGPTAAAVGAWVAMEAIAYLTKIARPVSAGVAIILDLASATIEHRPVVRVDSCSVCGSDGQVPSVAERVAKTTPQAMQFHLHGPLRHPQTLRNDPLGQVVGVAKLQKMLLFL